MAETTRIYVVINNTTGERRLVEASSQAQAIRHCVHTHYRADAASPKTVATAMTEGLKIENASTTTHTATQEAQL